MNEQESKKQINEWITIEECEMWGPGQSKHSQCMMLTARMQEREEWLAESCHSCLVGTWQSLCVSLKQHSPREGVERSRGFCQADLDSNPACH